MDTSPRVLVLGIGNVLWADEGFGVRCVEALQRQWTFAEGEGLPEVQLIDGGTQGLYLIQHVQAAARLLILDAIDYGLPPGTIQVIDDDRVPRFLGAKKMSLHQTGFQEVLMLAQLTGRYPRAVRLIGCQPEEIEDYGGSLRPRTKTAMETALGLAVRTLGEWGAHVEEIGDGAPASTGDALSMAAYEADRPDAEAACRLGDSRFLPASDA